MKRRDFIRLSGLSVPFMVNGLSLSALSKARLFDTVDNDSDRILVLIQLNGGNDGLNTLVPMDQYDKLQGARPRLILPENELLHIDNDLAMHPAMEQMQELYNQNLLTAVQGVAYPDQNRSHFRSTDIWTSASSAREVLRTGWIGRYFQNRHASFPDGYPNEENPDPFAITIGNIVSETCQGLSSNFSMAISNVAQLNPLFEGEEGELPDSPYGMELDFLRTSIKQTNQYAERVTDAAEMGSNAVEYTMGNRLADGLKTVANLISGGLRTRVYVVSLGGFDTHANQIAGNATQGMHADLLGAVSDAIFTFQEDLNAQDLSHRVIGMTFSEFGRQIAQNFSLGTDHGTAAPLFLFGNCVRSGIIGENAFIPDTVEPQEGVAMQYDFRDIYGSVLMDWFNVSEDEVRDILYPEFTKLDLFDQGCLNVSTDELRDPQENIDISVAPNPIRGTATFNLTLENSSDIDLRIFDSVGKQIALVSRQRLPAGDHQIRHDCHRLTPGNYYYRLQAGSFHKTKLMVVL